MQLVLFAQDVPQLPTTLLGTFIFVVVVLVGLVGWIMRHVFLTTIPAMQAAAKESQEQERKLCTEQFGLLGAHVTALTAAVATGDKEVIASINAHTTEQCTKYRHDVYDKIHEAVLGRDLYLATKKSKEAQERGREAE